MSKTNNKNKSSNKDIYTSETTKSKYVLANTVKANKITSKLQKSINNVVSDKNFIGYNENDYDAIEKMCNINDTNLFIKGKSNFANDITCNNNLKIKKQVFVGYNDNEINNLNNNTNLHIKEDIEINGNCFVYQNINSDKNINVQQCINIGFEKELPDNTSKLNVNGNSEFVGDNIIYGSEYIKNNLVVDDKSTFYNDVFLNNSLSLKKEIINDVIINDNKISNEHYKIILQNVSTSILKHSQKESSVLKFYSKKNGNIYSGLISVSKQFIINKQKFLSFLLVYGIYSNYKILSVKPISDTFVLIDTKENIVQIDTNLDSNIQPTQTNDNITIVPEQIKEINNKEINDNKTTQNSPLNLINLNKLTSIFKKTITVDTNNDSSSSNSNFISDDSKNSEKSNLDDFIFNSDKNIANLKNISNNLKKINQFKSDKSDKSKSDKSKSDKSKSDKSKSDKLKSSNSEKNILDETKLFKEDSNLSKYSLDAFEFKNNKISNKSSNKKKTTLVKKAKNNKNKKEMSDFDSDIDLDIFEVIK